MVHKNETCRAAELHTKPQRRARQ